MSAEFKKDRDAVLARYPMSAELRRAVVEDDIGALVPHTNAYLLRFYYAILGVKDAEFIERLNALTDDDQGARVTWLNWSESSQPATGR